MSTELRLPQLAATVTSAKLAAWLKAEGDAVAAGEPIVEVETDKTNVEVEAPANGILREIRVPAGTDGLETGMLLAVIADSDDADGNADTGANANAAGDVPAASAANGGAAPAASTELVPDAAAGGAPPAAEPTVTAAAADAAAVSDASGNPSAESGPAPAASPLGRRMAAAAGLDLGQIKGTGRGGRIGKADVERALAARLRPASASPDAAPATPALPAADSPAAGFREEPLSAMRRVTAERMQTAKQTVPHFYLGVDCAMDAALQLRARVNARHPDLGLTLTGIIVRAAALALQQVPAANSSWVDGGVRLHDAADIAVAVDTPRGLITPIVRQADRKGLREIAGELQTLSARARDGALTPEEYSGGTFTISNLGMHGVDSLYAIVNPPQSCILGVGAARRRPVAAGDGVSVAAIAACTLSADHRAIDGATGAALLAALRTLIEEPALLAL